jgi:hypothetical protein
MKDESDFYFILHGYAAIAAPAASSVAGREFRIQQNSQFRTQSLQVRWTNCRERKVCLAHGHHCRRCVGNHDLPRCQIEEGPSGCLAPPPELTRIERFRCKTTTSPKRFQSNSLGESLAAGISELCHVFLIFLGSPEGAHCWSALSVTDCEAPTCDDEPILGATLEAHKSPF